MSMLSQRMKKFFLPAIALCLAGNTLLAGNWFSSGPWANGAYYPGQYDGVYSATMFGGTPSVVSGILGFGLRNGSPSTSTNSTILTNGTQNTISVDPFQNYFVVFVDGVTYAGVTIANLNNQTDQVSGGLFNGVSPSYSLAITNTEVTFNTNTPPGIASSNNTVEFQTVQDTCGGGFAATLTGKKSVITFSGNNTGTLQTADFAGVPTAPQNTFSLNGMKVGNQTPINSTTATSAQ
jgi:hypothetical protein